MASVIGVLSGLITIFNFAADLLPDQNTPSTTYRFTIGADGTPNPNNPNERLTNAGGYAPDIRVWDTQHRYMGISLGDDNYCVDGSIVCNAQVDGTQRAPEWSLFTANNDAICIATIATTWPNSLKFGVLIGNWAEECMGRFGVSQASWFYSTVPVKTEDGVTTDANCAWIDGDGDQPATGIQVHWTEFDGASGTQGRDSAYYCVNSLALLWDTEQNPSVLRYPAKKVKRNSLNIKTSAAQSDLTVAIAAQRQKNRRQELRLNERFSYKLIKSFIESQSATHLCRSPGSAGPSFVSYSERKFCYMPTKTIFDFCEDGHVGDVGTRACWNDRLNLVVPQLADVLIPQVNFTRVVEWTGLSLNAATTIV